MACDGGGQALAGPRRRMEAERPDVQGVRGPGRRAPRNAGGVEVETATGRRCGADVRAEPDAGELELVVGRTLLRLRGRVEAEALTRVLDILEARA